MHTHGTWQELIALTRSIADALKDPTDRLAMLEIVTDYERSAGELGSALAASRIGGIYQSKIW
jgi:hypothetical protein